MRGRWSAMQIATPAIMSYRVVLAERRHLDLILPLFEDYRSFYQMPAATRASRSFLSDRIANEESVILFAADEGGRPVGFVQLYPSFSSVRLCRHWILNDLFVEMASRRNGVARALLKAATEFAAAMGDGSLELATQKTNDAAQRLYESMGWDRDVEFERYFFGNKSAGSAS
jgi:GNAT superfamily N-acetyltransferase